jgi:hypothetical protein
MTYECYSSDDDFQSEEFPSQKPTTTKSEINSELYPRPHKTKDGCTSTESYFDSKIQPIIDEHDQYWSHKMPSRS